MMELTTVLTKTTSGGELVVSLYEYTDGVYVYAATLNGQRYLAGGSVQPLPRDKAPRPELTHALVAGSKAIALTTPEAATLDAARSRAEDAYRASPAGRMRALRTERAALVAEVRGMEDAADARRTRAYETDDETYWTIRADDEPAIRAARLAVQAFDQAHPEVREALAAERRKSAARNAWM